MARTFFQELKDENITGVAYKNIHLKKAVISYFADLGPATLADLARELNISVPKVTNLVNDLIRDGMVQVQGKIDTSGGRKPSIYGLVADSVLFVGVDVKNNHINIGLSDLEKKMIRLSEKLPYKLDNTKESLEQLCELINKFIQESPVPRDKIFGVGVNLSGRINHNSGYSYSFFYFGEEPLTAIIESKIGIPIYLENDSRAMAYGEFSAGLIKGHNNVLFLNLDYGVGLGILIDGELYYGKSGYSGEVGHISIFDNEVLCHCGKKGCLETEASGWALVRLFRERLKEGSTSTIISGNKTPEEVQMEDIIQAAINDDVLAIELIDEIGKNIGRAIAILINLFNPQLVIVGGALTAAAEYIRYPILMSVKKYSLNLVNNDTELKMSKLGEKAGVIGACLLVRNKVLSL